MRSPRVSTLRARCNWFLRRKLLSIDMAKISEWFPTLRIFIVIHDRTGDKWAPSSRHGQAPVSLHEPLVVGGRVHVAGSVLDDTYLDAPANRQDPQLLQFFQPLQGVGRQGGQLHEERPAVGVE